jgi:hypothetical protein|tara:strand:- start:3230 stop:3934 length:705 start_codon:yes stop_codon:yes gene_type:complete
MQIKETFMSEQYVVRKITAMYPKLDKTYRYDSTEQRSVPCGPTDDGAEYSVNFIMDDVTAKALWSYMKTTYAEEKKRKKKKNWPEIKNPFKKTDDGMWSHKANLKGAYNGDKTRKPSQFDAKTNALPDDFQLTSGSIVNVAVKGIPYSGSMGAGCSLRLQAVQVLKLAERKQLNPFAAEDGYNSKEDNPFTVVVEEPVEKPIKEPTKVVKKTTSAPPTDDSDLSSIIDDWDDED